MQTTPPPYNAGQYNQTWGGQTFTDHVSAVMKRVYLKMTLALIITALVCVYAASSASYINFIIQNSWFTWVLILAQFGIVIGVNAGINRLSSGTASFLFYIFGVVMGLWLTPLCLVYTGVTLAKTFFITAGTFGAMSVYGYTTNRDLSRFGSILTMALFGLIIVMLVNMFMRSSGLEWVISGLGVLIFIGLTAWDTQQIKTMAQQLPAASASRLATLGALSLYLDFINLFLFLLRFMGNRD